MILDNVRFHHAKKVQEFLEKNPRLQFLFLPPYSPDLNPIENDFANLKKRRQFAPQYPSVTYPQVFVNLDYR